MQLVSRIRDKLKASLPELELRFAVAAHAPDDSTRMLIERAERAFA
jgi:hypothetical protein